jgi:hypothetical protein
MSFDSSKFSDPRGLNSSEDETRTQRFLTTISRDLGISSEKLSENAQASLRTIRWIMAILIQASLVRGLIS